MVGEDLRLRVLKAADEGTSARQAAARFGWGYRARSAGSQGPGSVRRRPGRRDGDAGRGLTATQALSSG